MRASPPERRGPPAAGTARTCSWCASAGLGLLLPSRAAASAAPSHPVPTHGFCLRRSFTLLAELRTHTGPILKFLKVPPDRNFGLCNVSRSPKFSTDCRFAAAILCVTPYIALSVEQCVPQEYCDHCWLLSHLSLPLSPAVQPICDCVVVHLSGS